MIQPLLIPTIIRQRVRPQKLTSFEVGQQLFNLGLKCRLLHNSYLTVSKGDWEKVIASDWIDRIRWAKDKFDCDEFARSNGLHDLTDGEVVNEQPLVSKQRRRPVSHLGSILDGTVRRALAASLYSRAALPGGKGLASKVAVACHPECSEWSGVVEPSLLRGAQPRFLVAPLLGMTV